MYASNKCKNQGKFVIVENINFNRWKKIIVV